MSHNKTPRRENGREEKEAKKIKPLIALQILFLVANTWAFDVRIFCYPVGESDEFIVAYEASADTNIPRAFALDIQLDNAETITSVTALDPNFWVYPGSYPGSDPVGDPNDSLDTLPGIDTNGITIEMASLYSPPEYDSPNRPEVSNDLLNIAVSGECTISIAGNAARGKVVFYDGTNEDDGRDVVYTGWAPWECWQGGTPPAGQASWQDLGEPECWCASIQPRQCHGDVDGWTAGKENYWVSIDDLAVLKDAWNKPFADLAGEPNICADYDHLSQGKSSYRVSTDDLAILKEFWNLTDGPEPNCVDTYGRM